MTEAEPSPTRRRGRWVIGSLLCVLVPVWLAIYAHMHPLVFNESFFSHAHCIPQTGLALKQYALDHAGRFPAHRNGYGDALLLLLAEEYCASYSLTGPGYDQAVFDRALTNHSDVPESECGRVYIQGLEETNSPELAVLFDRFPNPGDHTHLFARTWHPLGREVCFLDGSHRFIPESQWPSFAKEQMDLLAREGYDRVKAEALYAEKGKPR